MYHGGSLFELCQRKTVVAALLLNPESPLCGDMFLEFGIQRLPSFAPP